MTEALFPDPNRCPSKVGFAWEPADQKQCKKARGHPGRCRNPIGWTWDRDRSYWDEDSGR